MLNVMTTVMMLLTVVTMTMDNAECDEDCYDAADGGDDDDGNAECDDDCYDDADCGDSRDDDEDHDVDCDDYNDDDDDDE